MLCSIYKNVQINVNISFFFEGLKSEPHWNVKFATIMCEFNKEY